VAAAGNERSNSDQNHYYPADYGLKNIISVTAIDPTTEVLPSSNYGVVTVDLAAPGQNILSCLPGNSYGLMTGTSQATAFVSGAAALIMSHKNQYYQARDVKTYILATGDTSSSLIAKTKTSRQLNLFKSLTILGAETAVSGTARARVTDNFNADLSQGSLNEPNIGTDPNLRSVSNVAQFGRELVENISNSEKKRKAPARLGTGQNRNTEN